MRKRFVAGGGAIALLLGVLILLAGCGLSREVKSGDKGMSIDEKVALGTKDNGRQIELQPGQTLVVTLESNPTTGYCWEVAEGVESVLQQTGEAEFQPQSDLLGAPGVEILRFEATATGQATLTLVYHRPWEKGIDPLETFSVQVKVH
jgi:inhibitor of cysteine peptidase